MKKRETHFYVSINFVGFVLMLVAGWIDAFAIHIFLSENTSFLTGRIAKLSKFLFNADKQGIKEIVLIVTFFLIGAYLSTIFTKKFGLCGGLYFSGAIVILTAVLLYFYKTINFALITIPLSMGAQNAATSLTAVGRTTHLTGPITDIGINIAKGNWKVVLFWLLRLAAFIFGTALSYKIITLVYDKNIMLCLTMLFPGLIVIFLALLQKKTINIPLLDE